MDDNGTHGGRTKASILAAGVALWRDDPRSVSARGVASRLGMTHGAVLYHFGTSDALRDAIAAEAVRKGDTKIVPMLIAEQHPAAAALSSADRRRYLAGC